MSTTEALYNRREFFAFAGKKEAKHPKTGKPHTPSSHNKYPKGSSRMDRRDFLRIIAASIGVTAAVAAGVLKPWESSRPETLESLVAQAKRMEDNYKAKDLSDKPIREKFAGVIAGIFAFHYPQYFSKQQLIETVTWTDTLDQFVRQRMASGGNTGTPTARQLENERETTATTDNQRKKIIVNTAAEPFKQQNIALMRNIPRGWNPLRMLRISLLHEFNHLVTESTDEIIFSIIDPNNRYKDKRIEGFRFVAVDETGRFPTSFTDLHETVIELLAKDISLSDFGSHLSDMPSETPGITMDVIMNNLEQVLQAVGINHQELARLHKSSSLREFLVILADKAGADINKPLKEKIEFGSRIARIIQANDQPLLQLYLHQVRSINPTSSQK